MLPSRETVVATLTGCVALVTLATLPVSTLGRPLLLSQPQGTQPQVQSPQAEPLRMIDATQMAPISQGLKQAFERQSDQVTLSLQSLPPDAGLQALVAQTADLVAIARPLTLAEQQQGLVQVPITREKVAIVIGTENPWRQSLTLGQVVKIFGGEITNWSQVGGKSGRIRVLHPPSSDLRSALQGYPIWGDGQRPVGDHRLLETEGNPRQQQLDSTAPSAAQLGKDGISYALASQVRVDPQLQAIPLHNTLPEDDRYPFSQPLFWVHPENPNAPVRAFLKFVSSPAGQAAIRSAKTQTTPRPRQTQTAQPTGSPGTTALLPEESPLEGRGNPSSSAPWLPIGLTVLVLGAMAGGVLHNQQMARKQRQGNRPPPDYVAKLRNPNRQSQEQGRESLQEREDEAEGQR